MPTYIFWFLMLVPPKPGQPVYIERFNSPVDCQVKVIELRDREPDKKYECRQFKSHMDLSKPLSPPENKK